MERHIVVIPGDGTGLEVVKEAVKVLDVIAKKYGHRFVYTKVDAGGCAIDKYGTSLPEESLDAVLTSDSVLLGAVGGSKWDHVDPSIRLEKALLSIHKELGLHVNLHPAKIFKELSDASPLRKDIVANGTDFMTVRELIGGVYLGEKSTVEKNGELYVSNNMCYYAYEIEGIAHMASQTARKRGNRVISADKVNVLDTSRLWHKIVSEVAKEYPDVTLIHILVDNAVMQIVKDPSRFDVVVTENMFGGILSDETSMITGSTSLVPSASLGETKRGMYEPIHGSAPGIAGQNIANPIGAILAAGMMLEYASDMDQEAVKVEEAVEVAPRLGYRTKDIMEDGKTYQTCSQMGDVIVELIMNAQEVQGRADKMLIKNGRIHTMVVAGIIQTGIRVQDGKIAAIGEDLKEGTGELIIDASRKQVSPEMIETHCYLRMEESAIRGEGDDVNETSDSTMPQVCAIDGCNPLDETIINVRNAGITTVAAGPGSANVIGGTFMAYRTHDVSIDEMVVQNPVAMKCALGENPKCVYQDSRTKTRMNIVALLRETLAKIKEYIAKKEAANNDPLKMSFYDTKLEMMTSVVKKELLLKCHAHRVDDILTVARIVREFDVNVTLDYCADGEVIKAQMKVDEYPVIVGLSLTHKLKFKLANKSFTTPGVLCREGILIATTTDSPVAPQEHLSLRAAPVMKDGPPEEEALKAITINPAKILGLEKRIGNIEEGKDRDIIICDSSSLDV